MQTVAVRGANLALRGFDARAGPMLTEAQQRCCVHEGLDKCVAVSPSKILTDLFSKSARSIVHNGIFAVFQQLAVFTKTRIAAVRYT